MTRSSKMSEQWSNEEPIVGRLRNFMKLWQHLRVWAIYTPISGLPEPWDNKQIHIQMLVPDAAVSSEYEPSHLYFDTKSLKKQLVWNMRAPTIKGCSRSEVADCSQHLPILLTTAIQVSMAKSSWKQGREYYKSHLGWWQKARDGNGGPDAALRVTKRRNKN